MNNTWEIMSIIQYFNDKTQCVDEYSKEYEELEELYAQAIRLQCKQEFGYILTLDDFIDNVKNKSFIDYDGCGCFLDKNGEEYGSVRCDADWLTKFKNTFTYVLWFNK